MKIKTRYKVAAATLALAGMTTIYSTHTYLNNNQPTIAHNVAHELVEFDKKDITNIVKDPNLAQDFARTLDSIPENVQPVHEAITDYNSALRKNGYIKVGGMLGSALFLIGAGVNIINGKDEKESRIMDTYAK